MTGRLESGHLRLPQGGSADRPPDGTARAPAGRGSGVTIRIQFDPGAASRLRRMLGRNRPPIDLHDHDGLFRQDTKLERLTRAINEKAARLRLRDEALKR